MILLSGSTLISPLTFQVSHIKFTLPGSGILSRYHAPDVHTAAVLTILQRDAILTQFETVLSI